MQLTPNLVGFVDASRLDLVPRSTAALTTLTKIDEAVYAQNPPF